ncbi:MAG: histidine phosphatase family protein [Clostridia bacterium]|nr:histidine phosphatase family protein [Clostridia bacterium]
MLLFYIRHGDPIYKPNSLTPLGERQAEAIAKRLSIYGVDQIFSSSSERALKTAKPTCEILKKDLIKLDFCNEDNAWKELTIVTEKGKHWAFQDPDIIKLFATEEIRILGNKWYEYDKLSFLTEGIKRIRNESDNFLLDLGYKHIPDTGMYEVVKSNDQRVALFAHQGFGLAFLSSILDIPYPMFCRHFDMCHTGLTVIEFAERDGLTHPKILTLSSDAHLYREGLPTKYANRLYF